MLWFKVHQKKGNPGGNFGPKFRFLKYSSITEIQFNEYGVKKTSMT